MSLLEKLCDSECWEEFYKYKSSLCVNKHFTSQLRGFIDDRRYVKVYNDIKSGKDFPYPQKKIISKLGADKKRIVYTYPDDENVVLKLLAYLMLRKYDGVFSKVLYSFRPGRNAGDGVRHLIRNKEISGMYAYKADISNYFNSVPVDRLLPELKRITGDDHELYEFLSRLLICKYVTDRGEAVTEKKGIMAGTPLSAFYANLYLCDLDKRFEDMGAVYERYSDDCIVFAKDLKTAEEYARIIRQTLSDKGLEINPDKEQFFTPDTGWTFLGFCSKDGNVDISPVTVTKLKKKMRRKSRALLRWADRNGLPREKSAAAFIRIFNAKLFEQSGDNELTWALWYFPLISTDKSLKEIDAYAQDTLRYMISGKRTKARFNVRYEDLKSLGYRSLVNEYYAFKKGGQTKAGII